MEPSDPFSAAGTVPQSGFPDEAFECPYCGQLLAPSCRVCVSCKLPIDPARIQRPAEAIAAAPAVEAKPEPPPVRFSWTMFFAVLAVSWASAIVALRFLGLEKAQIVMGAAQLSSVVWVFFDARQKLVRRPLRWAVGSVILWMVFFPWYLARRRKLDAPCPFVESDSSPFTRVMLLVVFIIFLAGIVVALVSGPELKPGTGSPNEASPPNNSLKN
jgi:hypothetical protein